MIKKILEIGQLAQNQPKSQIMLYINISPANLVGLLTSKHFFSKTTSTQITVLIAYAIMKKIVLLDSLPLLLEMVSVMTRPIMLTAIMMVEIAASTSTLITALIVLVIILKTVQLALLFLRLEMVSVMTRPTMLTAIMMVETAVDPALILITALNVIV